jgi:hypothetical protein
MTWEKSEYELVEIVEKISLTGVRDLTAGCAPWWNAPMRILRRHVLAYGDEMEALRSMVAVDPSTGAISRRGMEVRGVEMESPVKSGRFRFNGRQVQASHVVWALAHGEWPPSRVYHKNGVSGDNRPANLTLTPTTSVRRPRLRQDAGGWWWCGPRGPFNSEAEAREMVL